MIFLFSLMISLTAHSVGGSFESEPIVSDTFEEPCSDLITCNPYEYHMQRELEIQELLGLEPIINPEEEITIMVEFEDNPVVLKEKGLGKTLSVEKTVINAKKHVILSIDPKKLKAEYKTINAVAITGTQSELEYINKIDGVKNAREEKSYGLHISHSPINSDDVWLLTDDFGDNITGTGIKIAVLDSGCDYTNQWLGNCNSTEFEAGECDVYEYGYDFANDDADPFDDYGHGTAVSSIIGSRYTAANNYRGVAPNVTLLCYKVCNSGGSCPESNIISAIENATDYGVDVIQLSLGAATYADEEVLEDSLKAAYDAGIIIVASAGNSADDWSHTHEHTTECPSCLPFL